MVYHAFSVTSTEFGLSRVSSFRSGYCTYYIPRDVDSIHCKPSTTLYHRCCTPQLFPHPTLAPHGSPCVHSRRITVEFLLRLRSVRTPPGLFGYPPAVPVPISANGALVCKKAPKRNFDMHPKYSTLGSILKHHSTVRGNGHGYCQRVEGSENRLL